MTICEKCWADAHKRAWFNPWQSVSEHYKDILKERAAKPCSAEQQRGEEL